MNLNIRSLFVLSQQIGKRSMIPNKYGRIINLASIAGVFGNSGEMQTIAYNTSKGRGELQMGAWMVLSLTSMGDWCAVSISLWDLFKTPCFIGIEVEESSQLGRLTFDAAQSN